jgi:hypothetical protein
MFKLCVASAKTSLYSICSFGVKLGGKYKITLIYCSNDSPLFNIICALAELYFLPPACFNDSSSSKSITESISVKLLLLKISNCV